jgi:hypothetical protein
MALTDTFVKNAKYTGKGTKEKHTDGGGMYLLVMVCHRPAYRIHSMIAV